MFKHTHARTHAQNQINNSSVCECGGSQFSWTQHLLFVPHTKISGISGIRKKYLKFQQPTKTFLFCTLALRNRVTLKCIETRKKILDFEIEMTPKNIQYSDDPLPHPHKKYTQNLHTPKNILLKKRKCLK